MSDKKVLIFGATGMLGHTLFSLLSERKDLEVHATVRNLEGLSQWFSQELLTKVHGNVDAYDFNSIHNVLSVVKPEWLLTVSV